MLMKMKLPFVQHLRFFSRSLNIQSAGGLVLYSSIYLYCNKDTLYMRTVSFGKLYLRDGCLTDRQTDR